VFSANAIHFQSNHDGVLDFANSKKDDKSYTYRDVDNKVPQARTPPANLPGVCLHWLRVSFSSRSKCSSIIWNRWTWAAFPEMLWVLLG